MSEFQVMCFVSAFSRWRRNCTPNRFHRDNYISKIKSQPPWSHSCLFPHACSQLKSIINCVKHDGTIKIDAQKQFASAWISLAKVDYVPPCWRNPKFNWIDSKVQQILWNFLITAKYATVNFLIVLWKVLEYSSLDQNQCLEYKSLLQFALLVLQLCYSYRAVQPQLLPGNSYIIRYPVRAYYP